MNTEREVMRVMEWDVNFNRLRETVLDYREQIEQRYEETARRYRLNPMHLLILPFALFSGISLYFMLPAHAYLQSAIMLGCLLGLLDFAVEHAGIKRREWRYPYHTIRLFHVPVELPLMSFMSGVILVFVYYSFGNPAFKGFMLRDIFYGMSLIQLILAGVGGVFFIRYFTRNTGASLILWALPWGIALYLQFPEPWLLAVAVLPVYLDYFLEKNLVKNDSINYADYNHEMAVNIALSYFPVALLFLGLAALLVRILSGGV